MIGLSRSPESSRMMSETDREESPPPAPDVTADPRAPKCQSTPSSSSDRNGGSSTNGSVAANMSLFNGPPLSGIRNNEVRSVMLYGVPIVALVIDGYERLCLAQISNTLLKTFSYNEIHNRRVALGITCVQCTPVQLELLRRAGAMPVSSRRCGLITKREAERLCKSFLAETRPPKLPDNFAFEVVHNCAWGCRGSFVPSRYNSSRAKCIKCAYCCLFFSPNKFIFHSHRLPDSKYVQPDAANFNSWRRHIKLGGSPPDEVVYAWEDVKAMFNGGSRKRILSGSSPSRSGEHKRSRTSPASNPDSTPCNPDSPHHPSKGAPYFPVVPLPNKSFSLQPGPAFVSPTGPPFGLAAAAAAATGKTISPVDIRQSFAEYMWAGKQPFPLPYGGMLWPRPTAASLVPQSGPTIPIDIRDTRNHAQEKTLSPYSLADTTTSLLDPGRPLSSASEGTTRSFPDPADDGAVSPGRLSPSTVPVSTAHASAFRPVGHRLLLRSATAVAASAAAAATMPHTSESTVDTTTDHRANNYLTSSSTYACYAMNDGRCREADEDGGSISSDHDEVDVTDVSNDGPIMTKEGVSTSAGNGDDRRLSPTSMDDRSGSPPDLTPATPDTSEPYIKKGTRKQEKINEDDMPANHTGIRPFESVLMDEERLSSLSKEELKEVLLQEAEARRRAEREYQVIRDTFEEQVRKEIAYREEVAKQLQIVREAHDALHHFSCKMLASRHCAECGYKPSMPE